MKYEWVSWVLSYSHPTRMGKWTRNHLREHNAEKTLCGHKIPYDAFDVQETQSPNDPDCKRCLNKQKKENDS